MKHIMIKILLVDVDSKIPNLVLMKLSTYYKEKGCNVELKKLGYDGIPHVRNKSIINANGFDKVFVSIIFTMNKNVVQIEGCEDVSYGGTGYDLTIKLPEKIDNCEQDYSIYPNNDISYGFITRGCIRNCEFCFVPKKEGKIHKYRNVDQIVKHKKVKFMDNNILAYPECEEILQEIVDKKIRCQFNQGIDIRLLTEKRAELLSKIKYIGEYLFAFDDLRFEKIIDKNFKMFKKFIPKDWKCKFYVYCNANMEIKDVVYRIEWCKENKALVFLMRDKNCWGSPLSSFYSNLASYCQSVATYKKMGFDLFMEKRTNNLNKRKEHIELYNLN